MRYFPHALYIFKRDSSIVKVTDWELGNRGSVFFKDKFFIFHYRVQIDSEEH
jgi:hypothetical protein